jgi:hypothetical protein
VSFDNSSDIAGVIALLVIGGLLFSLIPAVVASRKGYSGALFFVFALVAWPIALGVALLIEDKSAPSRSAPSDRVDQLERLANLKDSGALSPAEYEAEKRRVMAS